jgi:hypothetical protein
MLDHALDPRLSVGLASEHRQEALLVVLETLDVERGRKTCLSAEVVVDGTHAGAGADVLTSIVPCQDVDPVRGQAPPLGDTDARCAAVAQPS